MITPNDALQFLRKHSKFPSNINLGESPHARRLVVPRAGSKAEAFRRKHLRFNPEDPAPYQTFQRFVDKEHLSNDLIEFAKELSTTRRLQKKRAEAHSKKVMAQKKRSRSRLSNRSNSSRRRSLVLAFKGGKSSSSKRPTKIMSIDTMGSIKGITSKGRKFVDGKVDGKSASVSAVFPVKDAQNKTIPRKVLNQLLVGSGYIVTSQPSEAGVVIVSDNVEKDTGAYLKYGTGVVTAWSDFVRNYGFTSSAWDVATSRTAAYSIDDIIAADTHEMLHPDAGSAMSVGAFEISADSDADASSMASGGGSAVDDAAESHSDVVSAIMDPMDTSDVSVGGRRRKTKRGGRGRKASSGRKASASKAHKKKKSSARAKGAYPQFVKKFAQQHKGEYGNGPGQKKQTQLMKDAGKAWKAMHKGKKSQPKKKTSRRKKSRSGKKST
jgi:hypothetical protein